MIDINQLREVVSSSLAASADGFAVVPKDYKLEDLERFQAQPNALRGAYRTHDIEEFTAYVRREASDRTRIFINPETMQAVARIDHGSPADPCWGRHTAILTCMHTPEYAALLALSERGQIKTSALVDWLLDWRYGISLARGDVYDDALDDMSFGTAVQALRKIKITTSGEFAHEEGDLSRTRTAMERAAIVSDPPGAILLDAALYEGLIPRNLFSRLVYRPAEEPTVGIRIVQHAQIKAAMSLEFRDSVCAACADIGVHIGTFS